MSNVEGEGTRLGGARDTGTDCLSSQESLSSLGRAWGERWEQCRAARRGRGRQTSHQKPW